MAKANPDSDKTTTEAPAGAPELSDVQRQKIEAELTIDTATKAVPEQDVSADTDAKIEDPKGVDLDTLPGGEPEAGGDKAGKFKRLLRAYWQRKLWTLPLTLLVILAILGGVPYTRYKLAALVVSQPVTIRVVDSSTKKPVSSVEIRLDNTTYKTDKDGKVAIKAVKVGDHELVASKRYYKDESFSVFVPITEAVSREIRLTATGRQVPITVVNKISGKAVEDVTLKSAGSEFKTDKDGKVVVVVPADKTKLPVSLSGSGLNNLDAELTVTEQAVKENTFYVVPSGKLYFLSRQSGKIDVVKTDLDGSNRTVVVTGTGKEEDRGTVLLASRDWKYLAFLAKRDSGLAKLYLIDTSTDKMTEMDSGDASFNLVGWDDHTFVYQVVRGKPAYWEANRLAFKSYNVDKKQLNTIDQNGNVPGGNTAQLVQSFGTGYLIDHKLVYTTDWQVYTYGGPNPGDKVDTLRVSALDGSSKKDVKSWPYEQYYFNGATALYGTDELYIAAWPIGGQKEEFYEYEDGQVKTADADVDRSKFDTAYPTYLQSPDGKKTFWSEPRDGRETFFVGDASGTSGKQVAVVEDGLVYGWYGDGYVMLSKKGSELYIMPVDGGTPLKVADYHKPQLSYRGYGGGYGGL